MPLPQPPGGPTLRRRTALGLLVLSGSAACTTQAGRPAGARVQGAGGPVADPDVTLASRVLAAEQAVLDLVHATSEAQPSLAGRLAATAAVHARHVRLLTRAVPPRQRSASPSTSPSPSPSPATPSPATPSPATPAPSPSPAAVPHGQAKALQALARAEDELCASGKQAAFTARSGELARLLASMAAAAAQQAAVLRAPVRAGGAG